MAYTSSSSEEKSGPPPGVTFDTTGGPSRNTSIGPSEEEGTSSSPELATGGVSLLVRRVRPAVIRPAFPLRKKDKRADSSSESSDSGGEGGGVKLTPQPRRPLAVAAPKAATEVSRSVSKPASPVIEGLRPGLTPQREDSPALVAMPQTLPAVLHHQRAYPATHVAPPTFRMPVPSRLSSAADAIAQATGVAPVGAVSNLGAADVFMERQGESAAGYGGQAGDMEPVTSMNAQYQVAPAPATHYSQVATWSSHQPQAPGQAYHQPITSGFTSQINAGQPAASYQPQNLQASNPAYNSNFSGNGPPLPSPYAPPIFAQQSAHALPTSLPQPGNMADERNYAYLCEVVMREFEKMSWTKMNTTPGSFCLHFGPASETLDWLTQRFTQRPPLDVAFDKRYEPFVQRALERRQPPAAVLKIEDLPYEVKHSDIIAFIGGTAKILNDKEEPIHIMMERITTKTGAAYVEFYDTRSAHAIVDKHNIARTNGRPLRINQRIVTVTMSSNDALLKDLFPATRDITWRLGQPEVPPGVVWKGFVSEEELIGLVKNVEFPARIPFSRMCPQRSVDIMISILKKLPWHCTHMITIRHRYFIFKATRDMITTLASTIENLEHKRDTHNDRMAIQALEVLDNKLLKRLISAAMNCQGFSVVQKDTIAYLSSIDLQKLMDYHQPWNALAWKHAYTLSPNPTCPLDVVDYYVALIREETTRMVESLPLWLRQDVRRYGSCYDDYWGYFYLILGLPIGQAFDDLTLRECAILELNAIDWIMRRALPIRDPATAGPYPNNGLLSLPPAPVRPRIALGPFNN